MASKRFRDKACAYCSVPGIATVGEHVLARAFVPKGRDRDDLPKVPACVGCNSTKERLEEYAQVVAILAGRHPAAVANAAANLERKARLKPRIMAALLATVETGQERTTGGLVLPTGLLTVDPIRMREFTHMLVRGLFCHHSGEPLPQGTALYSQMTERDAESILVDGTVRAFGPDIQRVKDDLGGGVLRYEAILSTVASGASAWQIEFGQMHWIIGHETPRSVVIRRFVATMPPDSTPKVRGSDGITNRSGP